MLLSKPKVIKLENKKNANIFTTMTTKTQTIKIGGYLKTYLKEIYSPKTSVKLMKINDMQMQEAESTEKKNKLKRCFKKEITKYEKKLLEEKEIIKHISLKKSCPECIT